jgi:sec-independent protein translocase protein TatB
MIDLGLSKLAVIGVVALVVIGPERLPKVARMAGSLFGRAQRYINEVKSEVSREIELDELRKMHKDVREAASGVEQSIAGSMSEVENSLHSAWNDSLNDPDSGLSEAWTAPERLNEKARDFRKKKLRTIAMPSWYKKQNGHKTRVISGAARVARHRPAAGRKPTRSFHQ